LYSKDQKKIELYLPAVCVDDVRSITAAAFVVKSSEATFLLAAKIHYYHVRTLRNNMLDTFFLEVIVLIVASEICMRGASISREISTSLWLEACLCEEFLILSFCPVIIQ